MKVIYNSSLDPFFNLALEEYLLTQYPNDDFFVLWRNQRTVVVGKYQNAFAEINREYVDSNNINVVRRMTGGGAVFHDLGNLNFTFIRSLKSNEGFDFAHYCKPIIALLNRLQVEAKFEGRNDLTINGMKFVGNAALVWNQQTMYHGCILFSSDLSNLAQALKVNPLKYIDKSVKSVRKRVTNIQDHLTTPIDVLQFKDLLIEQVFTMYPQSTIYNLTPDDQSAIQALAQSKYSQWDWNFGKSPNHQIQKALKTQAGGIVELYIDIIAGHIADIAIHGDFFSEQGISPLEHALKGIKCTEQDIMQALENLQFEKHISNVSSSEFISAILN